MTSKAKYIGDPNDPTDKSESIVFRNVFFARGKSTEVPDDVAEKLKGNNHFQVAGEPHPHAPKEAAEKAAAEQAAAEQAAAEKAEAEKAAAEKKAADAAKKGA